MRLPEQVRQILQQLQQCGYEGYAVGGCVRDTLLGKTPNDWDICTSALPYQVQQCFAGQQIVETGIAHGTVTLVLDHVPYEITTYRVDGAYTDHRRPDQVQFVTSLREDLARRDFTINAMACGLDGQVQDFFGGHRDLEQGLVRCVGDPDLRFEEDALRILRALRFAAVLGFEIEPETLAAARSKAELLKSIAAERVFVELDKLICGQAAGDVLKECGDILTQVIPEIGPCIGFDHHNPCHDRDVWTHSVDALAAAPRQQVLRWALLLHDLAKPQCFIIDDEGYGHCYHHQALGAEQAHKIFRRLKVEKKLENQVCQLVLHHDAELAPTRRAALHWLSRLGEEQMLRLLEMKRCDIGAHADVPRMRWRAEELKKFDTVVHRLLEEDACISIAQLAVNGEDLMRIGIPAGPQIGHMLNALLDQVLDEKLANHRQSLLVWAKENQ